MFFQTQSGAVCLRYNDNVTVLTLEQVLDLKLDSCSIANFDRRRFGMYYTSQLIEQFTKKETC